MAAAPRPGAPGHGGSAPVSGFMHGAVVTSIANPELFDRLRALRKRLADAEGVPAYIVFSDAVLRQMAASVPRTRAEMRAISGVGPVKLERYAAAFLEILREA